MVKPNYEVFRYSGASDDEAIRHVAASRQQVYAKTGEQLDSTDQKLATFITTPTHIDGNEVLVRMTEFADENARPSGILFDSLLAESTGRRVISTNLPGIDFYGDKSTLLAQEISYKQIESLRHGSFQKIGAAVMQAVHTAAQQHEVESNYVVLGTSMSCATTAAAVGYAAAENISIAGFTFAEPVNVLRRPTFQLAVQFFRSGLNAGKYVAMNPENVRSVSEPVWTITKRAVKPINLLYAGALASDSLIQDLGPLEAFSNTPVYISRGAGSAVSPQEGFKVLTTHLQNATLLEAETFGDASTDPHDHAYALTVQSFIDAAQNILDRQP